MGLAEPLVAAAPSSRETAPAATTVDAGHASPEIAAAEQAVRSLTDTELIARLDRFTRAERGSIVEFLLHLQELDRRRLVTRGPHPSLFAYLTRRLRFSESSAWKRVCAARAAKRFPLILEMLADGRLHLEHVVKLAPYISWENHRSLLAAASGKSKREVDLLVACIAPRPARKDVVRVHGAPTQPPGNDGAAPGTASGRGPGPGLSGAGVVPGAATPGQAAEGPDDQGAVGPFDEEDEADEGVEDTTPSTSPGGTVARMQAQRGPDRVEPLSAEWVRIAFCVSPSLLPKLEKAKGLLKHKFPGGRLEDIFNELLDVYLALRDPAQRAERRLRRLQRSWAHNAHSNGAQAADGKTAGVDGPASRDGARTCAGVDPVAGSPPKPGAPCRAAGVGGAARSRSSLFNVSRRVPQWVREAVWMRDGGRCTYVSPEGLRCEERDGLELDHVIPFSMGGRSDDPRNIRLLCREHNQAAARDAFGEAAVEEMQSRKRQRGERLARDVGEGKSGSEGGSDGKGTGESHEDDEIRESG